MKFAISIVSPPDYQHSEAFLEIGETLHYALLEMGYDSILTHETDIPGRQHTSTIFIRYLAAISCLGLQPE